MLPMDDGACQPYLQTLHPFRQHGRHVYTSINSKPGGGSISGAHLQWVSTEGLGFTSVLAAEGALVLQKSVCRSSSINTPTHPPKRLGFSAVQYVLTDEALIYIVHLCCCKFMLHYTTICFASVRESCSNPNTSSNFIDICVAYLIAYCLLTRLKVISL